MNFSTLRFSVFGLMLCCYGMAPAATTFFSTLGRASDSSTVAQFGASTELQASDFLTGGIATTITSATFSFWNPDDINHVMTPKIFTDNSGVPGTLVGTFSTFTTPLSADPFTPAFSNFTATSAGINLAANTKYWMALSMGENSDLPFAVVWNTTGTNAMDAGSTFSEVAGTQLKYSSNSGSSWTDTLGAAPVTNGMFSLSGGPAAVPEPSRALLACLGLAGLMLRRRRSALKA